eukprot:s1323_g2.t1
MELILLVKSFGHLDFLLLIWSSSSLEVSPFTRSFACAELFLSSFGISRIGFLFKLPVPDATCFNSFPSPRSLAHPDLPLPVLDLSSMDSSTAARSMVRLDFVPSILGICLGSFSSASGFAHLELFPSVQSSSHPDPLPLLFSFASLDVSPSLHSYCRMGSLVPVLGPACFGLVSLLLVLENLQLESFLFSQASARLDLLVLILDLISMEFTTPLRQLGCLEPVVSILGLARFDLSVSLLGMSLFEPSLPSQSLSKPDAFIFILDFFHVDLPVFPQGFACFDSSSSIFNCISSDFSPSLRSISHLGVPSPALGPARLGPVSSPSVVAAAQLGASSSLRSRGRLEVVLPALVPWIKTPEEAADFAMKIGGVAKNGEFAEKKRDSEKSEDENLG